MNTGNNLLFLVVSGLLAFMSVTGLAGMINLQRLTPQLVPPPELFAGSAATFRLRLHNGKKRLPSFLIRLDCPSGERATLPIVSSGGSAEVGLGLVFHERGRASVSHIKISSTFPVNFFTRFWVIPLDSSFIVFPRLLAGTVQGISEDSDRSGSHVQQLKGADGELERIAPYSGREPLRMIHWKHTARNDELVVKEFGSQLALPLVIDLGAMTDMKPEERISRAAWLVRHYVNHRPVGLKLGKDRVISAATGVSHGLKLLTELALYGKD